MIKTIPLNKLVASPRNVRRHSDPLADAELKARAASPGKCAGIKPSAPRSAASRTARACRATSRRSSARPTIRRSCRCATAIASAARSRRWMARCWCWRVSSDSRFSSTTSRGRSRSISRSGPWHASTRSSSAERLMAAEPSQQRGRLGQTGGLRFQGALGPTGADLEKVDVILTNPPFGTKKGGGGPTRDDITYPTSNKQLVFLQHIYRALKPGGRTVNGWPR